MKTKGSKKVTKEQINLINELAIQGFSSSKIAIKLNLSKKTVLNYKENKKAEKLLSDETKKKIKILSKDHNISQISRQLNICRQTVRNYQK